MAPVREQPSSRAIRHDARGRAAVLTKVADTTNRVTKTAKKPRKKQATIECSACSGEATARAFPKHPYTAHCEHSGMTTCNKCTKKWIATQLEDKAWDKISCPECPEIMGSGDIKTHADAKTYQKYQKYENRFELEKHPGWRWCLNPHCEEGQVHGTSAIVKVPVTSLDKEKKRKSNRLSRSADDSPVKPVHVDKHKVEDVNIFICKTCNAKACVPCDRPYHEGETCDQYQRRNKAHDEIDNKYIETVTKQCPGCSARIEKRNGCDHMICSSCHAQFCWLCLVTYPVINASGHAKECMYSQAGVIDPHNMPQEQVAQEAMVLEQMRRHRDAQRAAQIHHARREQRERDAQHRREVFILNAPAVLQQAFNLDVEGDMRRALHDGPAANRPEQQVQANEALLRILDQEDVGPVNLHNLDFENLDLGLVGPIFRDHLERMRQAGVNFPGIDPEVLNIVVERFGQLFPRLPLAPNARREAQVADQ